MNTAAGILFIGIGYGTLIQSMRKHSVEYSAFLDAFMRAFYSRLPGFSATDPDCVPSAFLPTEWQNDL